MLQHLYRFQTETWVLTSWKSATIYSTLPVLSSFGASSSLQNNHEVDSTKISSSRPHLFVRSALLLDLSFAGTIRNKRTKKSIICIGSRTNLLRQERRFLRARCLVNRWTPSARSLEIAKECRIVPTEAPRSLHAWWISFASDAPERFKQLTKATFHELHWSSNRRRFLRAIVSRFRVIIGFGNGGSHQTIILRYLNWEARNGTRRINCDLSVVIGF